MLTAQLICMWLEFNEFYFANFFLIECKDVCMCTYNVDAPEGFSLCLRDRFLLKNLLQNTKVPLGFLPSVIPNKNNLNRKSNGMVEVENST